ncbi:MAG: hypothetical protein K0U93_03820, partial [Gammaproteobacteria bacterium]|nr:hypothetical protein [Gammaproteobacteria bacterium]
MYKYRIYCLLFCLVLSTSTVVSQSDKKLTLGEQPIFKVSKASQKVRIDGKMNEEVWARTEARTFDNFYRIDGPNDQQKTTFRMLWDEKNLYLFY